MLSGARDKRNDLNLRKFIAIEREFNLGDVLAVNKHQEDMELTLKVAWSCFRERTRHASLFVSFHFGQRPPPPFLPQ